MKKFLGALIASCLIVVGVLTLPGNVFAAGIGPTGGGSHNVGASFSVSIVASGTTFNAFQGTISVSGPVAVSVTPGSASWAPGGTPANHSTFEGGITSAASSFTIATITLRGTAVGSGSVSVSGVELVNNGSVVATGGGSTSFTITRAPTPPGSVTITSTSNPDQTQTYGVTTAELAWTAPTNGATGYSTVFDQNKNTTVPQTQNTTATSDSFPSLTLGTYYFHIAAVNGDGWGPETSYQINIGHVLNSTLKVPTITGVSKTAKFTEDINAGTVSGVEINGIATGLAGYTVTLTFTPASLPTSQTLTAVVDKDGKWQIILDQAIPVGFYKVSAVATQGQTTTPTSAITNIEMSVVNGGTAKIITKADLPKPDLTVKKWGIVFATNAQFHKFLGVVAGIAVVFALICFGLYFLVRLLVRMIFNKGKDKDNHLPPPMPQIVKKVS